MKKLFLSILFVSIALVVFSQNRGNRGGAQRPEISIKGSVVDSESETPLEFATISIFNSKDSSLISGGLSDLDGQFTVSVAPGRYYGIAEFIGYDALPIEIVMDREKLKSGDRTIDLGKISLSSGGIQLDEVEIRAEKSETSMTLDKRVFNVGKDLANRGGTAQDVLDNVPSVTVDVEGEVSLRGSTGVRILINGRPSSLAGADNANGLRAIPSNMIESVEVITNPSARYEAEGMAGIINIVLKKETRGGFNGSFDVNAGYPEQLGAGANINYRKGNINWFANYGLQYRESIGGGNSYSQTDQPEQVLYQDQDQDRDRSGLSNSIRAGIDYYLNDKENITGAFLYRHSDEDNMTTVKYLDYIDNYPANNVSSTIRTDDQIEDESNLEYSINYRKEYSSRKHELTASFQYSHDIETQSSDYLELATSFINEDVADILQRSNNSEGENTLQFQLDFKKPINGSGNFEIGGRSSLRNISNHYLIEEFQNLQWENLVGLSNDFNYDEDIHAAYVIYGNKKGKISYQVGFRGEYSKVLTELIQTSESNDRDYFNFFPSGHFNYELSEGNSMQFSYSRRLRRPRFWDLNPFFTFSDSRNTFSGNPNLDPELTNSYEISHLKYWNNLTLTSSFYYRHTTDVIQRILTFNPDGSTNRMPQNLATQDSYGAEMTFSYSGVNWLRLDGNINAFQRKVNGDNVDASLQADAFSWFARMSSRFTFWNKSDLQLRFNYRAPRESTQGRYKAMASLDFGFSKDVSKSSTLTISVRDIFNSRRRRSETFGDGFYRESEFFWRGRTMNVSYNYRINQKKKRSGSQRGEGDFEGGGEF